MRQLAEQDYDRKIATGRFAQLLIDILQGPALDSHVITDRNAPTVSALEQLLSEPSSRTIPENA